MAANESPTKEKSSKRTILKRSHEPTNAPEEDDNPLKAILKKSKKPKLDTPVVKSSEDPVGDEKRTEDDQQRDRKSETATNIRPEESSKTDIDEEKYVEDLLEDNYDSKRNAKSKGSADSGAVAKENVKKDEAERVPSKEKKKDKKDKKEKKRESKSPEKKAKTKEKAKVVEEDFDDEIGTQIIFRFVFIDSNQMKLKYLISIK